MIKILGTVPEAVKQVACRHCASRLEYTPSDEVKTPPVPTDGFAIPPYKAVEYTPGGWSGVENLHGFNCLTFPDKPGPKFTTFARAQEIAAMWNKKVVK